MLGTKLYKGKYTNKEYADLAVWCNANGCTIEEHEEYYEVVAIPTPSLEELKKAKLKEVDQWTANKIIGGFQSECSGELVTYDSDEETQLTVSSDLNTINLAPDKFALYFPNGYPMRGYPVGESEKVVYYLTFEQLIQWNVDLALHRGTCKQEGWSKQAEVKACTTKEELEAITLI